MDFSLFKKQAFDQLHVGGFPAESVQAFFELVEKASPEEQEILLTFVLAEDPEVIHAILDQYDQIADVLKHPEKGSVVEIIESATASLSKE
ncbi:hypothetical protein A2239_03355 [Candidatus Uhrbacteria bacterium RIFOXYA2_FULL_40_9]|nr:MAG: hypothetical protein A2239_03355 [Candidatus Uhrbacteria bacterium RIFOXYA2_FULL_40_9]OGL96541.1 MAG: hypothetical protein A2332_01015 [Candidatus Uhrbacteria bacterium RIFOXYB2_FULL_41_18]HBK34606.1 hypothetical protein [Candidatus Uhrbacteria bacterium]HCB55660.1 hypothetical protein [Candidatus Uhrbacteria bacterium]